MGGEYRLIERDEVAIVFKVRVREGEARLIAYLVDYNDQKLPLIIYADEDVKRQIEQLARKSVEDVRGWPAPDDDYPLNNQLQEYLLDCLAKRELKFKLPKKVG